MNKLKKIISAGNKHEEEYLDQDQSTAHNTTGTSSTQNTSMGAAQNVSGTTGIAGAGSTTSSYPSETYTSTAGSTTSPGTNYDYSHTGHSTTAQTASSYPHSQGYGSTDNSASRSAGGYSLQGHNSTGNTMSQATSGYPSQAYSTTEDNAPVTAGAGAGYSSATAGQTALDSAGKRLSRGPNEGTGISSGLGGTNTGAGNEVFEGGLTRGWGDAGDTRAAYGASGAAGTSAAQSGYPTGREDNTGIGATSTNTRSGQHAGHDAAAIGITGAAGEGSHLHQKNTADKTSSGTPYNPSSTSQHGSHNLTEGSKASGQGSHLHRQTGRENLGSDAGYQSTGTGQPSGHHLGRDAAIVGGSGAVGAGTYEYLEHEKHAAGSNAGYAGNTSGGVDRAYASQYGASIPEPHATNAANLLDPAVNTSGSGHVEDSHYHSQSRGGGAKAADKAHGKTTTVGGTFSGTNKSSQETTKHTTTGMGSTGTSSNQYPGRDTAAYGSPTEPYDSTIAPSGDSFGRDAAIGAAGVGATGLAAAGLHEHHKNEAQKGSSTYGREGTSSEKDSKGYTPGIGSTRNQAGTTTTSGTEDDSRFPGPAPHTAGPHRYDWLNKLDPRVNANPDTVGGSTTRERSDNTAGSDRHYGRDAAIGAGVGTAGLAYESSKHGHTKTDSGVAGVLPTDKKTFATDQYSSKPANTSKTTTSTDNYSSQPTTGQKTGGTTSAYNPGYQTTSAADTTTSGQHFGRDAAIIGGGTAASAGVAALGAHEYQGHERTIPLVGKGAQDTSDRLSASNTTAQGTGSTGLSGSAYKSGESATQSSDNYGSATIGPTVTYGSGTVGNAESTTTSNYPFSTTSNYSPTGDYPSGSKTHPDQSSSQHHYGRDAAIGTGGAGAAGLAAHELHKHDAQTSPGVISNLSTSQQHSGVPGSNAYTSGTSSGTTGSGVTSSKHGYRELSSGTPSGVQDRDALLGINKSTSGEQYESKSMGGSSGQYTSSTASHHGLAAGIATGTAAGLAGAQFGSNAPAPGDQYATKEATASGPQHGTISHDSTLTSGTASGVASSPFGSNVPSFSGDYNTATSKSTGLHSTMPGAFPETSTGLESYDTTGSTAQGSQRAGVGAQQYATTKHGPTMVASDETGHSKLHKEPPLEHLASTIKNKLGGS